MLEAVWIAGIVLAAIAAMDRRAWSSLALLALVLVQTALSDFIIAWPVGALVEIQAELVMRVFIDLCAGFLSLFLVTNQRWTLVMPTTFVLMLVSHATYWICYSVGVDLWLPFVHSQNALLIAQLIGLAWLGGGNLIGIAGAWCRSIRDERSRVAGLGVGETVRTYWRATSGSSGGRADERTHSRLHVSACE